jgi:hypothetical protein
MKTFQLNELCGMGKLLTVFMVGALSLLFSAEGSAQSINDWVGNRILVNEQVAIQRLESALVQIKTSMNQSPTIDANISPNTLTSENRMVFYSKVLIEIRDNSRTPKNAINVVAVELSNAGYIPTKTTQLVQELIALLS